MMKNILIIEPNWLGDVLFTTPAIRAIKEKYRDSRITAILHKRCIAVLEGNTNLNEIITINNPRGLSGFFEKAGLIFKLKNKKFDLAFLFTRSKSYRWMCAMAGIKQLAGSQTPKNAEPHRVEHYLNIVRAAGIDTKNKDYEFFLSNEHKRQALGLLSKNGMPETTPYIVINPGGNWLPKRWPKENFAKLADELFDKYGVRVIIAGAQKDALLGNDISKLCRNKPVNLCGETTLKQLAVILKGARAVIANDTGPMHIAVSQKAPTVAIFGPTNPDITGPYGSGRYVVVRKDIGCVVPCYDKTCSDYECMKAVGVEDVMRAVEKVIT
ncbi:MAG: lipopolysaccharide heptosyltransferase II [Candidatus Omnitrophota bacterium]